MSLKITTNLIQPNGYIMIDEGQRLFEANLPDNACHFPW